MSDLTNERIKDLGVQAKLIEEGDEIHLDEAFFRDIWAMSVELNARRLLAAERKAFWAQKVINHETPSDCSGTA